jgi:hypothetical protein
MDLEAFSSPMGRSLRELSLMMLFMGRASFISLMGKLLLLDGSIIKLYIDLVVSLQNTVYIWIFLLYYITLICYSVTNQIVY